MRATPRTPVALSVLVLGLLLALTACAGRTVSSGPLPTATAEDVTLTVDRPRYTTHQPIGVTVTNHSKKRYYATDGHSECTYLQLQRYDTKSKAWVSASGCPNAITPHTLLLAPNTSIPYTLAPGNSPTDSNAWIPGTYRVALSFGTAADGSGPLTTVYSVGIQISD